MDKTLALHEVRSSKTFLLRSASIFTEQDAGFAPYPGMYTVAAQLAHVAQTLEWLVQGAESPAGFDMDFERHDRNARAVATLKEAQAQLDRAFAAAEAWIESADLAARLSAGPGMPETKAECVYGMIDHTAHHRGALTVYARALGKVAPMPYAPA